MYWTDCGEAIFVEKDSFRLCRLYMLKKPRVVFATKGLGNIGVITPILHEDRYRVYKVESSKRKFL